MVKEKFSERLREMLRERKSEIIAISLVSAIYWGYMWLGSDSVSEFRRNVPEVGGYSVYVFYGHKTKTSPAEVGIGTAVSDEYFRKHDAIAPSDFIDHEYPEIRAFDDNGDCQIDRILSWGTQGSPLEKFASAEKLNKILQDSKKRRGLE